MNAAALLVFLTGLAGAGGAPAAEQCGAEAMPPQIAPIVAPFDMPRMQRPVFPDRVVDIRDHGAVGDGKTLNTTAIAKAIAAGAASGGGRVLVPEGVWLSGAIHLRSNIDLHLEKGAVLRFSTDPQDYLPVVFTRWAGFECYNYSPLIYARGCRNIAVTGAGRLDGQAAPWGGWLARQNEMARMLIDLGRRGVPVSQRVFGSPDKPLRPRRNRGTYLAPRHRDVEYRGGSDFGERLLQGVGGGRGRQAAAVPRHPPGKRRL